MLIYKMRYSNLCIRFWYMKSSASESKLFQSCFKSEIPSRVGRKERFSRSKLKQAFLIDSDAKLFMYLPVIQCIRFGSYKGLAFEPGLSLLHSLSLGKYAKLILLFRGYML